MQNAAENVTDGRISPVVEISPMLIEAPLDTFAVEPEQDRVLPDGSPIDWLDLTWRQCLARAGKWKTRAGHPVHVLLRLGQSLHHGDLLGYWPDGSAVVVDVPLCPVIRVRDALARAAYLLGDLHQPVQMHAEYLLTVDDDSVAALLARQQILCDRITTRFQPDCRPTGVQLAQTFQLRARQQSREAING